MGHQGRLPQAVQYLASAAPAGEVALQGQLVQAQPGRGAGLPGLHLQAVHQHLQLVLAPGQGLLVGVQLHGEQVQVSFVVTLAVPRAVAHNQAW